MDEMRIGSRLILGVINRLLAKTIKQKYGYDVDIKINEINVSIKEEQAFIHLSVDAATSKNEVRRIIKDIGL